MVDIPVNSQRSPAAYLARKFAINYNITMLTNVANLPPVNVPVLSTTSALALAAFALLRLRTAQLAATDDGAGTWDAELAAAQVYADKALAEVSAAHTGYFPTAQRIFAKLQRYGDNYNSGTIPAPGSLPLDWATNRGAQPSSGTLTVSKTRTTVTTLSLLSGITNAESATETLSVLTVNGKNFVVGQTVTINGIVFTMAAGNTLTCPAQPAPVATFTFPVTLTDGVTAPVTRTVSLTLTA